MRIQTAPSDLVDILIAEEDALLSKGLRQLLEGSGYRCAEAQDGHQALGLALQEPPRCVLLDLAIPGLDGFAVARRLRSDLRTAESHIHGLTASEDALVREQARLAGCEECLRKPPDGERLLHVIRQNMERETLVRAAVVSGLTKTQAEHLLDWLENHDCTGLAVTMERDNFTVRCVCPPGLRLGMDEGGGVCLKNQDLSISP
jgi:CheY-like chemotaxis protein